MTGIQWPGRYRVRALAMVGLLLGLVGIAAPAIVADEVLTIGFTTSETGELRADALPQLRGFKLWRDRVNAAGGIQVGDERYRVELVHYNDGSNADRVPKLYSRLILEDGADFLFSPYSSDLTAAAAVVSEQYDRIMVTAGAAGGKTYKLGNRYLYQIYTPAERYLIGTLSVLAKHDPDARIALIYSNDGFSRTAAEGARLHAEALGLPIVFREAYPAKTREFGPLLDQLAEAGADVLVGGGHFADGSALARQLYRRGAGLKLVSLLGAPDLPEFAALDAAAYGVTVPSQWAPSLTYRPDFGPTPRAFAAAYRERYGVKPGYHAAGAYAAGLVLQHAIERAGSVDTEEVATALDATDAMIFFGRIAFSTDPASHGLQIGHHMVLTQWQRRAGGALKSVVVWPSEQRIAPLIYPLPRGQEQPAGPPSR